MNENELLLAQAKKLVNKNRLDEAQSVLDGIAVRDKRWHFIQSEIFFKKNWMSECKKHLEKAMELDPFDKKLIKVYEKLTAYAQPDETLKNPYSKRQMGKSDFLGIGAEACAECGCMCCCEGILQGICDGL